MQRSCPVVSALHTGQCFLRQVRQLRSPIRTGAAGQAHQRVRDFLLRARLIGEHRTGIAGRVEQIDDVGLPGPPVGLPLQLRAAFSRFLCSLDRCRGQFQPHGRGLALIRRGHGAQRTRQVLLNAAHPLHQPYRLRELGLQLRTFAVPRLLFSAHIPFRIPVLHLANRAYLISTDIGPHILILNRMRLLQQGNPSRISPAERPG